MVSPLRDPQSLRETETETRSASDTAHELPPLRPGHDQKPHSLPLPAAQLRSSNKPSASRPFPFADRLETTIADDNPVRPASGEQPSEASTDGAPTGFEPPQQGGDPGGARIDGEPAASAPPAQQATSIVSQEGDSFWLIAQRVYGDGRYFNALYECNRRNVPSFNEIPPGTRISTPPLEDLRARWPDVCPRETQPDPSSTEARWHTTAPDETLFEIASDELGQASRYLEILEMNRDRLPPATGHATPLPAGIKIRLPDQ
jgi:nucleoid-associated protein YgaU